MQIFFHMVENIEAKGANAGYQFFFIFPQCFQKASFKDSLKACIVPTPRKPGRSVSIDVW